MDKYTVFFSPQAYRDIDETYEYIRTELFAEKAALDLVDDIEDAILSLKTCRIEVLNVKWAYMPERVIVNCL